MPKGIPLIKRMSDAECLAVIEAVCSAGIRHKISFKLSHVEYHRSYLLQAFGPDADKMKRYFPEFIMVEAGDTYAARMLLKY